MGSTLVIGATGNVGRHLVEELTTAGVAVRALVRTAAAGLPDGVDVVHGDLTAPDGLEACAAGVEAVFLLWPFLTAEAAPSVLKAIGGHARRVVYLSSMSVRDDLAEQADPISGFHADMERLIEGSGLEWTFLRAGGFATNTLQWAPQIRAEGVVRWPYGAAARSLIDERDIAAVAARVLTGEGHHGARYTLTGPETLTQVEQVRLIGEAIGRPPAYADGALGAWAAMARTPEPVTSTVEEITGTPPRTFRRWALDHVGDFSDGSG
jgi:uncharacterized protein YbjT (DUF2867 family)